MSLPMILLMVMLAAASGNDSILGNRRSSGSSADSTRRFCDFDLNTKTYNATDLFLCMNELARDILFQYSSKPNGITDRAYQDSRQSYPAYQFASDYSIPSSVGGALSNYFGNQMLSSLFSGGLPMLPNLSNLLNFGGIPRPGNFLNALSSIAQYDDLKCVPRILCEVASGSMPGSLTYRQSSTFQDFGSNAIFGLLGALDRTGTSPLLSFGRAAFLGFTSRGQPSKCYREYSRCPQDADQLISYLNNHNGGFFRFFNSNLGQYYRPQQSYYRPQQSYYKPQYYKNSEYRIIQTNPTQQSFIEAETDHAGYNDFSYGGSNNNQPENHDTSFFQRDPEVSSSSRFVFPKERREDSYPFNQVVNNGHNSYNDYNSYNYQKEFFRKDRKFFPQETKNDETEHQLDQSNSYRKQRAEVFGNQQNYLFFPRDRNDRNSLTFMFPSDTSNY